LSFYNSALIPTYTPNGIGTFSFLYTLLWCFVIMKKDRVVFGSTPEFWEERFGKDWNA
jgi:hypothetical protein